MTVQRADKATLDIKTKKLTIWNTNKKFRVDIATGDQDCNFSKGRVEYTPGSGVVMYATLPD
ncbi:hypothetical protein [Dyadobacter sandarakinus]|uniref:Uncharacterized protein n=1 Tax=Dyadobacter sandarakinus TaxID=2747268 RepID=A0ABX7I696_9BACT|nr:hypothetical protein [Dyadobacter sandarakinus]QRR01410.1 hypothetical protein HWI92_11095 [Dyadobacter sandarakinus]